jgi:hypothetical protein
VVVAEIFPYNKEYYSKRFFDFYKDKMLEHVTDQHNGEDLHGSSECIYGTAIYKAAYVYFSLLKFDLLTTRQELYYFQVKYDLLNFADTLLSVRININDLIDIFEIDPTILTVES